MRKIDTKTHRRFITALEGMIRDMDAFGYTDTADELVISRDELEDVYRKYNRKIGEINELIHTYYGLFDEKHSEYVEAVRIRQKENTRLHREELAKDKNRMAWSERKRIIPA
jgi:hypothetical protein